MPDRLAVTAAADLAAEAVLFTVLVQLMVIILAALATSWIGIFAIFGAFMLGTVLSDEPGFREIMTRHLRNFLAVIFLPIFLTYTGLRTNVGALEDPAHWLIFAGVLGAAVLGKLGGCAAAARLSGFSARESLCIGTMMNAMDVTR